MEANEKVLASWAAILKSVSHYEHSDLKENAGGYTAAFGLTLDFGNWFPKGHIRIEQDGSISATDIVELHLIKEGLIGERIDIMKFEHREGMLVSSTLTSFNYTPEKWAQFQKDGWKLCRGQKLPTRCV